MAAVAPDVRKMSFAKAAASATKDAPSVAAMARTPVATSAQHRRDHLPAVPIAGTGAHNSTPAAQTTADPPTQDNHAAATTDGTTESKLVEGLRNLQIETKTPNLVVNGTGSAITDRSSKNGNSQTPSEENSLKADSSSELGTKPPSLDGKSITSGTTFALDEKESLRPDDSASVKAAAEDDDAFSIRGSLIAPGSRMGSEVAVRPEVAVRVHQIQLGDMPPRTITTRVPLNANTQRASTPPSSGSDKQPVTEAKLPLVTGTTTPDGLGGNLMYRQNPDEKLLEAIQSPKDRLFLLRLEAQVINFVQDSKEPFMDLPPCNSFCRMLTHKLADYYHMTHSFEAVAGAVRIYRTPFCRVPPPLSGIIANVSSSSSPAPAVLPRKIMRRGQNEESGSGSAGPSKTTSEAGSDGKEKAATVDKKLTREEREEKYNKARERIFGSIEKNESTTPENDDSNGVSRASSVSAKDKSALGKKKTSKQRRDDSESFDSRSQYVAYCGPQQPTWGPAQYMPVTNTQFNGPYPPQQQYPNALQPIYNANQSYPQQMVPNNGFVPAYHPAPNSYPPAQPIPQPTPPPPRFQPQGQPVGYGPSIPAAPPQGWQQQNMTNHSPYQARATPVTGPVHPPAGIPYAYGQLPVNVDPNDPKSQHPIPGSYNRNGFNPKTQSFVPSNGMAPMPTAPVPYGGPSPHHGSPQFNSPHMGYASYQQPMLPQPIPPQPAFPTNGTGYGMARQGSNNSLPPYHHPPPRLPPQQPQQQQQQQQQQPHGLPHGPIHHGLPSNPIAHNIPNKPAMSQGGPGHAYSSTLPHYGNPATLPQKPT